MPSAESFSMPALQPLTGPPRRRLAHRIGQWTVGLFRRLLRRRRAHVADLPEALRCDVGLGASLPDRADRFWDEKRRSAARDLPL